MHGKNYRQIKGMAYTRKQFAPGAPNPKVARFTTGKSRPDYDYLVKLVSDGRVQIRHNALEAARVACNKKLALLGEDNYFLVGKCYPHLILRENKMIATAGADRLQEGMRKAFGKPIADVIGPHPYAGFQAAFDPLLTPGARNYWKSHYVAELSDAALDILLRSGAAVPDPQTEIFIAQMGGATSKVPEDATAYRHRDANFIVNVHGRWSDPAKDKTCIGWCRELFDALKPHAMGGAYVNFMTEDEQARVTESDGENYARLAKLKGKYDPQNLFHLNQNIRPQAAN